MVSGGAAQTIVAVHRLRRVQGLGEGPRRPHGDRDVGSTGQGQNLEAVASGGGHRDVAVHATDGDDVDLGLAGQVQQGQGVVDSGVAVDHHRQGGHGCSGMDRRVRTCI